MTANLITHVYFRLPDNLWDRFSLLSLLKRDSKECENRFLGGREEVVGDERDRLDVRLL